MKKKLIFSVIVALVFSNGIFSQSEPTKTMNMKYENQYPRIEFYTDRDYADHSNWSDKYESPDGKVYHMGARRYEPFIDQKIYLLNEQQTAKLLQSQLVFLPYFGEIKENTTFDTYFKTSKLEDYPTRKELFPSSLEKYLSYPKEDRLYYNTIIGYEQLPPLNVYVVWLDKDRWYVDDVFYRMEIDELLQEITPIEEKQLVRGTIENFMKHSFVIQSKLSENLSYLRVNTDKKQFKKDEVVLEIALTPGGPGSSSYSYIFYADGKISVPGLNYSTPSYFLSHIQWVDIQSKAREINFKYLNNNLTPVQFVHDGQSRIVGAFENEYFYRLVFGHGNPMPENVSQFVEHVLKIISEIDSNKNILPKK